MYIVKSDWSAMKYLKWDHQKQSETVIASLRLKSIKFQLENFTYIISESIKKFSFSCGQ